MPGAGAGSGGAGSHTGGTASQAAGAAAKGANLSRGETAGGGALVDPVGQGMIPGVTRGKYILIEVPNFNDSEADPMHSYLRLGAVKDVSIAGMADAPKETGEDLAAYVTGFIDDTRVREGCDATGEFTFTPVDERLAETAILHTKGGWRDHSDGNRITTTRGDKVEVVRGNYKMVVLGRTDREDDASVTDSSGGHSGDSPITFRPGYENHIQWVPNYDGTWKVTETTVRGDVHSTYHGDTVDHYFGNVKSSTTGSEAPGRYHENPTITDRTWAVSIASYTGSSALPVPTISDETFADSIASATTATSIASTTEAAAITDVTTATTMSSVTTAATITDTTTAAAIISNTIGNTINNQVGTDTTTTIGNTAEVTIGGTEEVTIGSESSITVGTVLDVQVALFLNLALSGGIDISIGPQLQVGVFQVSWNPLCLDLEDSKTHLATMENKVNSYFAQLAAVMFLG